MVGLLRQRSRPYLFSNTLAPSMAAASIAVFDLLSSSHALRDKLQDNTDYFRKQMAAAGFDIRPGNHPIVVSGKTLCGTCMHACTLWWVKGGWRASDLSWLTELRCAPFVDNYSRSTTVKSWLQPCLGGCISLPILIVWERLLLSARIHLLEHHAV